MHCHTFFSFNAYGYSPASLAWLAKKHGFAAVGIVDFDVLDAVDEFLAACDLARRARQRGHRNTRLHPRVRHAARSTRRASRASTITWGSASRLARRRPRPRRRWQPCAPAPNGATGRWLTASTRTWRRLASTTSATSCPSPLPATPPNVICCWRTSAPPIRRVGNSESQKTAFWAEKLGAATEQVTAASSDYAKFSNLVRGKLMKRGGVGYVQPSPEAFPTVAEFHAMIVACGALPCAAWLDGTSTGEQAIDELLGLADRARRGGAQHHPGPQLEHRRSGDAQAQSRQAARDRPDRRRARSAAERRHRDERAGQQAGGRLRCVRNGAGETGVPGRRLLHLRAHRHCSGRWGWAIKARGRRPTCGRGANATRSTRPSVAACRQAKKGWQDCAGWTQAARRTRFWRRYEKRRDLHEGCAGLSV